MQIHQAIYSQHVQFFYILSFNKGFVCFLKKLTEFFHEPSTKMSTLLNINGPYLHGPSHVVMNKVGAGISFADEETEAQKGAFST